jgi:hypothetical protein
MGTSDFSVECWANANQAIAGGWVNLVTFGSSGGKDIRIAAGGDFFSPNGGKIGCVVPNDAGNDDLRIRTNQIMTPNTWYHFALVRNGSILNFYINGVAQTLTNDGTGTAYTPGTLSVAFNHSGNVSGESNLFLNNSLFNESSFEGNVSNIRLVKGLAVYTSNFTPPNAPVTSVSDTKLLMNTNTSANYLQDSSSYNHVLTATGTVSYSSLNPFS